MSKLKRIIFSIIATLGLAIPLATPAIVHAQDVDRNLSCGANLNFDPDCEKESGSVAEGRVNSIVTNVINILSLVVCVAAVIMIMIGGMRYITSNGDSGQVGNAKNTILYAIVGLIVVALAQVIVRFVVNKSSAQVE